MPENVDGVALRLTVNGTAVEASMVDNATAREFCTLLPLTIRMSDMLGREAYGSGLPAVLTAEAPRRTDYKAGELVYWPPTNGIAVYYKVAGSPVPEPGLIPLGRITRGLEAFQLTGGAADVTIDVAE
ncbi:cyclophilin-like fold protein [Arthrobacter sp. NPDC093128]|uniref:cyclophilin-like fold protein n=1 Tax=Arthrobacter sp. NPDC093128 TaxID=3154979 RepID=UPI003444FB2C